MLHGDAAAVILASATVFALDWASDMGNPDIQAAAFKMSMMMILIGALLLVGAKIAISYYHDHVEVLVRRRPDKAQEIRRLHSDISRAYHGTTC